MPSDAEPPHSSSSIVIAPTNPNPRYVKQPFSTTQPGPQPFHYCQNVILDLRRRSNLLSLHWSRSQKSRYFMRPKRTSLTLPEWSGEWDESCRLCEALVRGALVDTERSHSRNVLIDLHHKPSIGLTMMSVGKSLFQTYALEGQKAESFTKQSPPYLEPASKDAFRIALHWLRECDDSHPLCRPSKYLRKPSRLVAIRASRIGDPLSLRLEEVQQYVKYTSLTYCWGGDQIEKTIAKNLPQRMTGIDIASLPLTIQDAALVTYRLGIPYLWVDSLCIVQDNSNDVAKEMQKMGDIYRGAYVTISASCAKKCQDGFLQSRVEAAAKDPWYSIPVRQGFHNTSTLHLTKYIWPNSPQIDSAFSEPINTRAWTLQESLLSSRALFYSSQQVFWRCRTQARSHGGMNNVSLDESRFEPTGELSTIESWIWVVMSYSRRTLSLSSDKLLAIAALAQEHNYHMKDIYLAGLWRSHFPACLCWSTDLGTSPTEYRAPSWSWAAVDRRVYYSPEHFDDKLKCTLKLLSWNVEYVDVSLPYGSVLSAQIIVEGRAKKWTWHDLSERHCIVDKKDGHVTCLEPVLDFTDSRSCLSPKTPVWTLEVFPSSYIGTNGLLLVEEPDESELFRRIGSYGQTLIDRSIKARFEWDSRRQVFRII